MKTTILMVFSFFLICQSLAGQKFSISENKFNKSSGLTDQNSIIGKVDTSLKPTPSTELFAKRNQKGYISSPNSNIAIQIERPHSQFQNQGEKYPGSSVYFARKSSGMERTNEKFFIIRPDSASKYYLLVKNPLENIVAR